MEVKVVRGVSPVNFGVGEHNIYVGISLGNKWFTKENMREQLLWCLKFAKEKVGLLVADTLHATNYEVRNGMTPEKARAKALNKGDELIIILKELIAELPEQYRERVEIIRWDEIREEKHIHELISIIKEEFENNELFRSEILRIIDSYTSKETRKLNKIGLARYLLEELPELLNGFKHKGIVYDCYTYPQDNQLTQFIEKLQNKQILPELHKKLKIGKNIFVALNK